ncbi:MAG: hypothetical protein GX825_00595 [Syntrophomonadaceae bacterium]|nr:hypothetical protein [Syntrophomonadaceae bacterium]
MNCPETDKLIEHYLNLEDIPQEQWQELKAHADQCPTCQCNIDYAVREGDALRFEEDIPALEAVFTSKVMSAIKQEHSPKPISWFGRLSTGLNRNALLAGGLAAGVLISWLFLPGLLDKKDQTPLMPGLEQDVESGSAQSATGMKARDGIHDENAGTEFIADKLFDQVEVGSSAVSKAVDHPKELRLPVDIGERSATALPGSNPIPVYRNKEASPDQSEITGDSNPNAEDTMIALSLPDPDVEEDIAVSPDAVLETLWHPEYIPEGFVMTGANQPTEKNYIVWYENSQGDSMTLTIDAIADEKSPLANEESILSLEKESEPPTPLVGQSANSTSWTKENAGIQYQLELTSNLPIEELNKVVESMNQELLFPSNETD